jgi:hypothetical protein
MDDDALFSDLRDKLFTAVVGDALDKLGSVIRPDARVDGIMQGLAQIVTNASTVSIANDSFFF